MSLPPLSLSPPLLSRTLLFFLSSFLFQLLGWERECVWDCGIRLFSARLELKPVERSSLGSVWWTLFVVVLTRAQS